MHWFIDPIKDHYFDFEGRVTRKPFWMFVLGMIVAGFVVGLIAQLVGVPLLSTVFSLALLLPSAGITARRLHDTGLTGWVQLIGLIPVLGLLIMIVLCARPGTVGANKYGVDPRASVTAAATEPEAVAVQSEPVEENKQEGFGPAQ